MSAPTEAEIRGAIRYRMTGYPGDRPDGKIRGGIQQMADFMYGPSADVLTGERARGTSPGRGRTTCGTTSGALKPRGWTSCTKRQSNARSRAASWWRQTSS